MAEISFLCSFCTIEFEIFLLRLKCNIDVMATSGNQKHLTLEFESCDFLKILAI